MKKYDNNLVFVDLLFNLLVGFTSLFVIAFMLINPIAKKSNIDPPVQFIIECLWNDHSITDIDLYARGPDGTVVYYGKKDGSYMVLQRDDLGTDNDTFVVNGESVVIRRNYEMITMSALPAGEYVINVHYFSTKGDSELVEVRVKSIVPLKEIITKKISLNPQQEATIISFNVDSQGHVYDLRSDIHIPLRAVQ